MKLEIEPKREVADELSTGGVSRQADVFHFVRAPIMGRIDSIQWTTLHLDLFQQVAR